MERPDPLDGTHHCHFCGTLLRNGVELAAPHKRHWLSDCRPDLTAHILGALCTWPGDWCYIHGIIDPNKADLPSLQIIEPYPDGPM